MKTIKIPGAMRELFGEEITVLELVVSIVAFMAISALLLTITFEE